MQSTGSVRWFKRYVIRVGSPAVIGAIIGFAANHAAEAWRDDRSAGTSLLNTRIAEDDKRIDDMRGKLNAPAETCDEVKVQERSFAEASESIRTESGRTQLRPLAQRLADKQKLCLVYAKMLAMPDTTAMIWNFVSPGCSKIWISS